MAEKPQLGPATPASTPGESAALKHADATGAWKLRIPPDFHDVTAERAARTSAIIGYPVATPRDPSKPAPPPLQFPAALEGRNGGKDRRDDHDHRHRAAGKEISPLAQSVGARRPRGSPEAGRLI
jgi:hypothetical protein